MPLGLRALFFLYSISIEAIVWCVVVPAVWVRALVTGDGRSRLHERLAPVPRRDAARPSDTGPVLVHAVSLGEMHAAAPLIDALAAKGHRVFLTTWTPAGLEAARRLARSQSAVADVVYLPWDRAAMRRWLSAIGPSAVVVMETEIWPNLFRACADLAVPLFIANGRIRPVDVWKYRLARPFFAGVLQCATWIGVQSPAERDRFLKIGAPADRVHIAGNLKFDAALVANPEPALGATADVRPLIVAGSTHDPEERWLLECVRLLEAQGHPARLVLAPRDIARAGHTARLAHSCGFRARLWSESSSADWDVLVLDRYATLRACYASADLVVIGGTFVPVGGHSMLEPAALDRPIVVGPYTQEIAAVVQPFADAGAVVRVSGPEPPRALAEACGALLADRARARAMGARAGALCREGAGGAARYAEVITEHLAAAGRPPEGSPRAARSWWRQTPRAPRHPTTAA